MNNTVHLLFEFFERLISALLLIGMVVVIGLAAWSFLRLTYIVSSDPLVDIGYVTFQTLFDRLLAAVIALELARSVLLLVEGHRGLMQVRIILVIGLLAVVRKLILIELEAADPALLFALAAAVLALAASLVLIMYMDPKRDRQE
ncbi:phosphate-starvation-inducible PsiE family protein [Marivita sp.]|uniref:phosphate-starvation-inducible PsiE family protein n=1 Tax=Marivita sp. TaxID=2003365 RepID=UPI0025C6C09D|nr:phosphate-starvation-inducible PsiE family protein [Marivita sp.]